MAGGVGSRFWPESTTKKPKQFLDILGTGETLLQQTWRRMKGICPIENIYVVTHKSYADLCKTQIPELSDANLILEPARRNTAPCIAYATFKLKKRDPLANFIVTPSDHLITNEAEFKRIIEIALDSTREHNILLTLGITPHRPESGYGYIQFKDSEKDIHPEVKKVKTFTEKPDYATAVSFIESGEFLWNSGIFVWNANALMNSLDRHLPELYQSFEHGWDAINTEKEQSFIDDVYPTCENESIDYGILEKANNVYVLPADFGWSDLGSWGAVHEQLQHDENGNSKNGRHVFTHDSKNNIIHITPGKVAVVEGLEDYIVIESENRILICRRKSEQDIKHFVNDIKMQLGDNFV